MQALHRALQNHQYSAQLKIGPAFLPLECNPKNVSGEVRADNAVAIFHAILYYQSFYFDGKPI